MDISFLLRGMLLGLSIAAPVGPMGVLCINRTLNGGRLLGLITGVGVATADAIYGFIAAFGLTFITNFLVSQSFWIRLIGGSFLLYLGVKTFLSEPAKNAKVVTSTGGGLVGAYTSALFLTLTNPTTILSFVAIFAGMGLGNTNGDYTSATILVIGTFLGSALWWLTLSGVVSLFRTRFNTAAMRWVNRGSGLLIITFGLLSLASLLVG